MPKTKDEIQEKVERSVTNAALALGAYGSLVGDDSGDIDILIVDLLADLKHFCKHKRIDYQHLACNADLHFIAEVNGDS